MKKLFTFIFAICIALSAFAFTACTKSDFSGEVTKEQWDLALVEEKFSNVTIDYGFNQGQYGKITAQMLIDGDKVFKIQDKPSMKVGFVGERAQAQKSSVLDLFMGLIAKYENFTYSENDGVYTSTDTISITVTDDASGYSSVETLTNGKVKFSSDFTIEYFMGDITETIYYGGQIANSAHYQDIIFTFKDFGTTVVDFKTEVPYFPQATYTEVTEQQWIDSTSIKFDCEIKQTLTMLENEEIYYVMEEGFIRSGNVIKYSDGYISIEGDKYFEYNADAEGNWARKEIEEYQYIQLATFAELTNAYSISTFDTETGLYVCEELDIGDGQKYYNLKMGFVDGKLTYAYYEDVSSGMKPVFQCYFEYKTVEVNLPTIA